MTRTIYALIATSCFGTVNVEERFVGFLVMVSVMVSAMVFVMNL